MIIPYIGGVRNAVYSLYIIVELGGKSSKTDPKRTWIECKELFAFRV